MKVPSSIFKVFFQSAFATGVPPYEIWFCYMEDIERDKVHQRRYETMKNLRLVIEDCLSRHLHSSAIFFADKLVTLGDGGEDNIFLYAQTLFLGKQYRRALSVMSHAGLICNGSSRDIRIVYSGTGCLVAKEQCASTNSRGGVLRFSQLAAHCYAALHEWGACLKILGEKDNDIHNEEDFAHSRSERSLSETDPIEVSTIMKETPQVAVSLMRNNGYASGSASVRFLRGKSLEALGNRASAKKWFKLALIADPFCFEAFEALISNHMLTAEEEQKLLANLRIKPEDDWLRFLYNTMCKEFHAPLESSLERDRVREVAVGAGRQSQCDEMIFTTQQIIKESLRNTKQYKNLGKGEDIHAHGHKILQNNSTAALARAEKLFSCGQYHRCYDILAAILHHDPFMLEALPSYIAAAVELCLHTELYLCSHRLVQEYPERAITWFAVACYYFCIEQFDASRRYFSKSIAVDGGFAPSWIGFGHSFSAQDDSDQALTAYRTASRIFPGSHLPLLFIGMEYQRSNNLSLAEQFFMRSLETYHADPFTYNELGVLAYQNRDYSASVAYLAQAISMTSKLSTEALEITTVNLAHAHRKQNNFDDAIVCYERALRFSPRSASTYTSLGFTHQLKGNFQSHMAEAIACYHKALGIRLDDGFAQEMLTLALIDQCAVSMPPYHFVAYNPYHPTVNYQAKQM
jgi:anaphase-promoting complex subunit 6